MIAMKTSYTPNETDKIKSPLWDLMLSVNDCFPGCGCEDDFFDMTLDRVKIWILQNDSNLVLDQISNLTSLPEIDIGDVQLQTGYPFQTFDEFKKWLMEWKELILKSLKN